MTLMVQGGIVQVAQVTIVHSDVLEVRQLPEMMKAFQPAHGAKLKVVANIPYNITSGASALMMQLALLCAHDPHPQALLGCF